MSKDILRKITFPLFFSLNLINKIIYKDKNKIVLYSNLGFRDNVKAIYDYLIENNYNHEYKIVCSLNDFKEYRDEAIENVIFTGRLKGIIHFLTSKYFLYSFGKYPIKPSNKQMVVNLWHGAPLKKIGNLEKDKQNINYNYFTYVLATSELFSDVMKRAFSCSDKQVLISGQPRNDKLLGNNEIKVNKRSKLVVWLPTFRNDHLNNKLDVQEKRGLPFFTEQDSLNELNNYLKQLDMQLLIKLHLRQTQNITAYEKYEYIKFCTDEDFRKEGLDLYELLSYTDALITDYSSVYFDYLLLDRQIGFIIDDINEYSKERGFVFENPEEYMPGKKITNEKGFYEYLNNVSRGYDEYKGIRDKVNKLANHYTDGGNCERVLEFMGIK